MNKINHIKIKKITALTAVLFSAFCIFAKPGDTAYVAVSDLNVKEKAKTTSLSTGRLSYADKVLIVSESKKWILIDSADGSVKGWVPATSLSKRKLVAKKITVNASEITLAGKGISPFEQTFSENYEAKFDLVDRIESIEISDSQLKLFCADGKLTSGESNE